MHLKHTRFTYCTCTCISFTKHKGRIQKLKTLDSRYIDIFSKNELEQYKHGMAYCIYKDSARRTASD